MLKSYLESLSEVASTGDAREESYYSVLEDLLSNYANSVGKREIHVRTLPKKTEAGNPDFRIWDGQLHIVGYIEAKPPTVYNLDQVEDSEQLQRYRHTFPNLLLTNFFEFRFYRKGDLIDTVSIARPFVLHKLGKVPPVEKEAEFFGLLEKFFSYSFPAVEDARTLAVELAKRTRFLKEEVVAQEMREEEASGKKTVLGFYEAFREYLIMGLSKEDFADLYSQTITYGLFAARTRSNSNFNRRLAYERVPSSIGILRDVFRFISLESPPTQMEWIIDDISEVLSVTDVKGILHSFFHEGKGSDPIVHFYETFLAEYDPEERTRRGVFYTPEPVVSYIVRSLNLLLKDCFDRPEGLAGDSVTVLDPAVGTLTFMAEASRLAVDEFVAKYGDGGKHDLIQSHILTDFYAFELQMAPYAVGHLKIAFLLEELGYILGEDERFNLYLTNTLEMEELAQTDLPGMASLSEESHLAGNVKKKQPILVILGNPPYFGMSANRSQKEVLVKKGQTYTAGYSVQSDGTGIQLVPESRTARRDRKAKQKTWIGELIEYYKYVDGQKIEEKNPKWLQDDYVKFIRFAEWKIGQTGEGILGFVTNHSYLDNPTFRGMRQSLMNTFDEIYLLDLHGSAKKKERCPDGSRDENVFDITQGVAVGLFVKRAGPEGPQTKVYHADMWGLRAEKYSYLISHDVRSTRWKEIHPRRDLFLFVPRDEIASERYDKFIPVTDMFPVHSVGIVTARDKLTIRWSPDDAWKTVVTFSGMEPELAREAFDLGKDVDDWKVALAQRDLRESGLDRGKVVPILYRPFDLRHTYYTGNSRGFHCRPRPEVMKYMMSGENIALITARSNKSPAADHFFVSDRMVEAKCGESTVQSYTFPLYLDSEKSEGPIFAGLEKPARRPNLNPALVSGLGRAYSKVPEADEVLAYVYAVFHSRTYRTAYRDFLKTDFPRIPFTADHNLFLALAGMGQRLVDLHLMRSSDLEIPVVRFEGQGDNSVSGAKKVGLRYESERERVCINETQYFEPVAPDLWEYQIGGYQVLEKWLKDRRGRQLSLDEIKRYCRIVTAIKRTIEVQEEIDALYPEVEKSIVEVGGHK